MMEGTPFHNNNLPHKLPKVGMCTRVTTKIAGKNENLKVNFVHCLSYNSFLKCFSISCLVRDRSEWQGAKAMLDSFHYNYRSTFILVSLHHWLRGQFYMDCIISFSEFQLDEASRDLRQILTGVRSVYLFLYFFSCESSLAQLCALTQHHQCFSR